MKQPILLIEDSDEDYTVLARALEGVTTEVLLRRCTRADEALDYLYRRGNLAAAPRPALILLDLNLPGTDGRALLARIKGDDEFRVIPVVVVTTSSNPRDVLACYRDGANGYHIKSVNFPAFKQEMQRLVEYWLRDCLIPARAEEPR